MIRRLRDDPATPGTVLFLSMVLGGFVALGVASHVVRNTLTVAFQVPALISGGIGGLALIIVGSGLGYAHLSRRLAAGDRQHEDAALAEAHALAAKLSQADA